MCPHQLPSRGPCHNVPHTLVQLSFLRRVRHRFTVRILFGPLAPNRSQVATKCERESSEVAKLPVFPPRPGSQILLCDIFHPIPTSLINLPSSISYLRSICCALSSSQTTFPSQHFTSSHPRTTDSSRSYESMQKLTSCIKTVR